jgi:hypothetical protein
MRPERTLILLVGATGFEPATPCAQGRFKHLLKLIAGARRQLAAGEEFRDERLQNVDA